MDMHVEPEKMNAPTNPLEPLPNLKKIVLTIPQTHPHNIPTIHTGPHISLPEQKALNFPLKIIQLSKN